MKIEAVSSWADTKSASFRENHWTHQHFFPLSCLLGVFCCAHHRPAGLSNISLAIWCSIMASPAYGKRFQLPVLVCVVFRMENITVNLGFVTPFSSASHSRLNVGPSCRRLPALFLLQQGRGPERCLRLPLQHSIHHLCATQPVSSCLRHALPSNLRLLSLYEKFENHISKRPGEELHLIQNRTKASSFYLNVHEISILHL